jgi:PQQ-dependent dehydrogenase (methanol/ethanol family)
LTYGGDYAERHYSPLNQINQSNVTRLGLAWQWDTGGTVGWSQEATPLVRDGVIYSTAAWNQVFALDARTGKKLWLWDPGIVRRDGPTTEPPGYCFYPGNRGLAMYGDKVYIGLRDGRLVALNMTSGLPVWSVQTTPVGQPYAITGAPRIVNGKVVIGNAGADCGVRGFIAAYDAETGERRWRSYTVPGDPSKDFENEAMRRAAATWTGEWWKYGGGGTVWDAMAYDPDENLLYVGTGNGSPWPRTIRSPRGGDNLYLSSILAINPDTGELKWHYQTTPGDDWDYTATQPLMLLDLAIEGRTRQVIVQASKNGFFYVLDRLTGDLLSAQPYVPVTWAKGIDLKTRRPIENPDARYGAKGAWVRPGTEGGHTWEPMSYNPSTGLVYFSFLDAESFYSVDTTFQYTPGGVRNNGMGLRERRPQTQVRGVVAWDPVRNREVWRVRMNGARGTLSTAGNLVFVVARGRLTALDARTGATLWSAFVGGAGGTPVAYELEGRQYVAVAVNASGELPRFLAFVLDGDPIPEPAPTK